MKRTRKIQLVLLGSLMGATCVLAQDKLHLYTDMEAKKIAFDGTKLSFSDGKAVFTDNNGAEIYTEDFQKLHIRFNLTTSGGLDVSLTPEKNLFLSENTLVVNNPEVLRIYNLQGQLILSLFNPGETVDVSDLPSGVYIVKADDQVKKVVKQ